VVPRVPGGALLSARIWLVVQEWENGYHRDSFDSFDVLSAHASEEAADAERDRLRADTCDAYPDDVEDEEPLSHDFGENEDDWCVHCESGFTVVSVGVEGADLKALRAAFIAAEAGEPEQAGSVRNPEMEGRA